MMTTFTNAALSMAPEYDLNEAVAVLATGGLILLPTDAAWCVACDATQVLAVRRLNTLFAAPAGEQELARQQQLWPLELIFAQIPMLRAYVERLHPRLETLLEYHIRPLTVVVERPCFLPRTVLRPDGSVAVRLAQDALTRQLVAALGRPIATAIARPPGTPMPTHFGRVRSDIIQAVDYVVRYRQGETMPARGSVMVQIDANDEMIFLRD